MNDNDKKLLELAEKATPRPWHKGRYQYVHSLIYDQAGVEVATAYLDSLGVNADYIIAVANAVPKLIVEKEALLKRIMKLRTGIRNCPQRGAADYLNNLLATDK